MLYGQECKTSKKRNSIWLWWETSELLLPWEREILDAIDEDIKVFLTCIWRKPCLTSLAIMIASKELPFSF